MRISEMIQYDMYISKINNVLYRQYCPGWKICFKSRTQSAAYYVVSGEFGFVVDGEKYKVGAGSIVIFDANTYVELYNAAQVNLAIYQICFFSDDTFSKMGLPFVHNNCDKYLKMFIQAYEYYHTYRIANQMKIRIVLENILYGLICDGIAKKKLFTRNEKLLQAVDYINVNYMKEITVSDLCKVICYSPSHVRRMFIKEFNISPIKYINKVRIERAKEYLEDDNMPVYQIAEKVGFKTATYFSKTFREMCSVTPVEYRKILR